MRIQIINSYNQNTFTANGSKKNTIAEKPFTIEDLAVKLFPKDPKNAEYIKGLDFSQAKLNEFKNTLKIFPKINLKLGYKFHEFRKLKDNTFDEQTLKILKQKAKSFPSVKDWDIQDLIDLIKIDDKYIHQVSDIEGQKGLNGFRRANNYNYKYKNTDTAINLLTEGNRKETLKEISQNLKSIEITHNTQSNPILLGHIAFEDNIDDPVLLSKINKNLDEFKKAEWEIRNSFNCKFINTQLQEIMIIQDVVNSYKNIYTPIYRAYPANNGSYFSTSPYKHSAALDKLVQVTKKEQNISKEEARRKINKRIARGTSSFAKDVESNIKNAPLQDYIEFFGEQNFKTAKYLYQKYYIEQFPEHIQKACTQIANKFGTFIFLPIDYENVDLKFISKELSNWKKTGKSEAVLPKYISFSKIDSIFIRDSSSAFASRHAKTIGVRDSYYKKEPAYFKHMFRHEIMHINDTKYVVSFKVFEYFKNKEAAHQLRKKQWHRNEFINAGIPKGKNERHINYAYKNKLEFLAVAAEGNMKKYSAEFKNILENFGMKRWIMNLPHFK